jgi:hypothetical protein
MTKFVAPVIAAALALAFLGWGLFATRNDGSWTGGSHWVAAMIAAGALGAVGLTILLVWLALLSERRGFDKPPRFDPPTS